MSIPSQLRYYLCHATAQETRQEPGGKKKLSVSTPRLLNNSLNYN